VLGALMFGALSIRWFSGLVVRRFGVSVVRWFGGLVLWCIGASEVKGGYGGSVVCRSVVRK